MNCCYWVIIRYKLLSKVRMWVRDLTDRVMEINWKLSSVEMLASLLSFPELREKVFHSVLHQIRRALILDNQT